MECTFTKKSYKNIFICRDFNIDLLNPNKHKITDEFINTMHSMSLIPIITRTSKITSYCATLIDNIFSNNIQNNTVNGLLIIDISDHLPVFTVYDYKYRINKPNKHTEFRRVRSEESINKLKKLGYNT